MIAEEQPATAIAAVPATMDMVSMREDIFWALFAGAIDLRVAAGAGTALGATRKVAARLPGTD
jgi:hypothetical protein